MPKFTCCVQQFVEQIAEIEIEADTPEEAAQKARDRIRFYDPKVSIPWGAGDDIEDRDCYAVKNDEDEVVWER